MGKPTVSYDEPSDTLYISFEPGEPATGIELGDHILLRINVKEARAVGITVFEYSLVAQDTEIGPRSFPLPGLDRLPEELRGVVLRILSEPPVNGVLSLFAHTPSLAETIPITSLKQIPVAAL